MSSINGFGSAHIGCSDVGADGSYITTEWVIAVIPLVPIRSLRLLPTSHSNLGFFSSSTFQSQPVPLHWPHVLWMYATYLAAAVFFAVTDHLLGPESSGFVASPLLSSLMAFAFSVFSIWVSRFIREGSTFASLIVFAVIITFSFVTAGNISAHPDTSWRYMYFLWAAYATFYIVKYFKTKDSTTNRQKVRH